MKSISSILKAYLTLYSEETSALNQLIQQADHTQNAQMVSRRNFQGHLTASGLVFSNDLSRALLIRHKTLGIYLQPGGHFDHAEEMPRQVALREIREETGLEPHQLEPIPAPGPVDLPFHINTHPIPANPAKGEPAHFHHDFCYLFRCTRPPEQLTITTEENAPCHWFTVEEFLTREPFTRLPARIRQALA